MLPLIDEFVISFISGTLTVGSNLPGGKLCARTMGEGVPSKAYPTIDTLKNMTVHLYGMPLDERDAILAGDATHLSYCLNFFLGLTCSSVYLFFPTPNCYLC